MDNNIEELFEKDRKDICSKVISTISLWNLRKELKTDTISENTLRRTFLIRYNYDLFTDGWAPNASREQSVSLCMVKKNGKMIYRQAGVNTNYGYSQKIYNVSMGKDRTIAIAVEGMDNSIYSSLHNILRGLTTCKILEDDLGLAEYSETSRDTIPQ